MFAPAIINGRSYYDGGIYDEAGLMALPGVPSSKLIVNIICGDYALKCSTPEALPEKYKDCRLLTLVMEHIPRATPFTMAEMGPVSYHVARLATRKVFSNGHIQQVSKFIP